MGRTWSTTRKTFKVWCPTTWSSASRTSTPPGACRARSSRCTMKTSKTEVRLTFFRFSSGRNCDGGNLFLFLRYVQRSPVSCRRTRTPPSSGTSAAPPWPGCVSMRTACSTITSSWTATRIRMWKSCRASWCTVSFSTAHRWRNKCSWRYLKSLR